MHSASVAYGTTKSALWTYTVTQIWHLWSLQPVHHSSEMICLTLKLTVDLKYRNVQFFLLHVHCSVVCRPMIENICISVVHIRVYKLCNVAESFSTALPKLANGDHHKPVPCYNFAGIHFLTSPSWSSMWFSSKMVLYFNFSQLL